MNLSTTSLRRLQLLANGYSIIPSRGKIPAVFGWNDPEWDARELQATGKGSIEERIAKWESRFPDAPTTGIRITGGMRVIDADVDDEIVDELSEHIQLIAPNVFMHAPTRFGGGTHKMALFARAPEGDDAFVRVASHKYIDGEKEHCVEIFGGAPTQTGKVSRQFGAYGPHTIDEKGNVVRDYIWAEGMPDLLETPFADLPTLSKAQALAICGAFEVLAIAKGWKRVDRPPTDGQSCIYDIVDETMFDVMQGADNVNYAVLCEMFEMVRDLRVSSSFFDGVGSNRSKCQVGWHRAFDCVGVYDHEDAAWHLPKGKAPIDENAFAQELKRFAEREGVELAPTAPNWRDRFKAGKSETNGAPRATLNNAVQAIEHAGFVCSEDTFHERVFIGRSDDGGAPMQPFFGQVTDASLRQLRRWLDVRYGLDFNEKNVFDAVMMMAHANAFDPVLDMLDDAQEGWDKQHRIDNLTGLFCVADTPLHRAFLRKTVIAAVARARQPGCKFDTIPVLEGPEGFSKSTAWRVLAGDDNFSDERVIGHANKEVIEQLGGVWIHESADLAGMRKAEVETVKAFASRQVDRARPAYGRVLVERPRRGIHVATTNNDEYLQSQTGNRRFWPMRVERPIDIEALRRARLQIWGEAAHFQAHGEYLTLHPELWGEAAIVQDARRVRHPWEALIDAMQPVLAGGPLGGLGEHERCVVHVIGGEQRVFSASVFEHVLKLPAGQLHAGHAKALADAMRVCGWERKLVRVGSRVGKGYAKTVV